jgi:hypothetical protein
MTVNVYRSTDAGAPVANGTVGSLIGLLDACLVNGYDTKAGAGWTKEFSGTNLAAYKNASNMSQAYYRVDHTVALSPKVVGYEVMTDINTGTGQFPTSNQIPGGLVMQTSTSADSTPRWWTIVASQNIAYILINPTSNLVTNTNVGTYCFGAFNSYMVNDAYNNFISGTGGDYTSSAMGNAVSNISSTNSSSYCPRSYSQIGSSVAVGKHGDTAKVNSTYAFGLGNAGSTYPNPVDGSMIISSLYLHEINAARGVFPGFWFPCHVKPLVTNDTLTGTGPLSGKTLEAFTTYQGQIFLETSDTW